MVVAATARLGHTQLTMFCLRPSSLRGPGAVCAALLCWLALGCDRDGDKTTLAVSASAPKAKLHGLSIAGEEVQVKHVFTIGTEGESALRWVLGLGELSCETLRKYYPARPPATHSALDLVLMQPMGANGKRGHWSFLSAHITDALGSRGLVALAAMVDEVKTTDGKMTASGLELALQDRSGPREVLYSGDVTAIDCGRVKRSERARPQRKLKVRVGAEDLSITGASLRHEAGKYHLRLTRAPHGCNSVFTTGYDMVIDLTLAGDPPELTLASLGGECLPNTPSASLAKQKTTLRVLGSGLTGAGPVTLTLDVNVLLHDYKLSVVGEVQALRCVPTVAP